jgi:predicted nucleic acid-binding protein
MSEATIRALRSVFVDTSAHYALIDRHDANHPGAATIGRRLAATRARLYTTNFVLAETHALLLTRLGRAAALDFLERMELSHFSIVRVSPGDERAARDILRRYDDKDFSLTDATSFAVMQRLGISAAVSFDRHFAQYGLTILTP